MRYMHEGSMEIKVGGGLQNITNITAVYLYVEVEHQSQFFFNVISLSNHLSFFSLQLPLQKAYESGRKISCFETE